MSERDAIRDAILNGRDRRDEIEAEWKALGLEVRRQSPTEMRRVLMTWAKAQLVEMVIRANSDAIKAQRLMLDAWRDAQEIRDYALVLPREEKRHAVGNKDPFNAWLIKRKGQTLDAKTIFEAGWVARVRAEIALSGDGETSHE